MSTAVATVITHRHRPSAPCGSNCWVEEWSKVAARVNAGRRPPISSECVCGCNVWRALIVFDAQTYEVAAYMTDVECADCGRPGTAPTPLDVPEETT